MKIVLTILIIGLIVYAYAFSWHDYCIDKKSRSGAVHIACHYEPQVEEWLKGS